MRIAGATALMFALALSGCISTPQAAPDARIDVGSSAISLPIHRILPVEQSFLKAFDGIELDVAIFKPEVPDGTKTPVILDLSPYYGNSNLDNTTDTGLGFHGFIVKYFVPRGYTVVHSSVRGTGNSGACYDFGGEKEQKDAQQLVEWLGKQPWSNGRVGMVGKSYDGTTPWEAAIGAPEALKTIVPISGITDMYRYMYREGISYWGSSGGGVLFPTYYTMLIDWDMGFPPVNANPNSPVAFSPHPNRAAESLCPEVAENLPKGYTTGVDGDHDAFWDERDYSGKLGNVKASVFLIHGLQDWNVKIDNAIPQWDSIKSPKKMWLGQWAHDYPNNNRFNKEWSRSDWNETLTRWFDYWLKDGFCGSTGGTPNADGSPCQDNGIMDEPAVLVQDNTGRWHTESTWPPAPVSALDLHLTRGGLKLKAEDDHEPIKFRTNLEEAGRYETGQSMIPDAPVDAPDRLFFKSDPLDAAMASAGEPTVSLYLAINRDNAHLSLTLFDVAPNGTMKWVNKGFLDLRHRESRDKGTPMEMDKATKITFKMYAQETVFEAGHSIGLSLKSEDPDWILEEGRYTEFRLYPAKPHDASLLGAQGFSHDGAVEASMVSLPIVAVSAYVEAPPMGADIGQN
ncbi:MAG: CocE/NonD family hydrolase [Euryarchaeota archaeon]|nr:CocE/NonD family hydrolase [Euryarchaeota archaeon]